VNRARPSGAHEQALADYLDELLRGESDKIRLSSTAEVDAGADSQATLPDAMCWSDVAGEPEPDSGSVLESGVQLPCGRIRPDDERYFLFAAGGLSLAIPAHRVSAERALEGHLEGPPGALVRAMQLPTGLSFPVLDLARLMLPASSPALEKPLEQRTSFLVMLDNDVWACAAETPGNLEALDLEQVCWRGEQGSRPWLAGTVAARRLVLLDLDAIAGMLP
jgi:purine-binding chemotaxis protein CheW